MLLLLATTTAIRGRSATATVNNVQRNNNNNRPFSPDMNHYVSPFMGAQMHDVDDESIEQRLQAAFAQSKKKMKLQQRTLQPLVLVPGLGGSRLFASRSNAQEPHWWCRGTTSKDKPYPIWIALQRMIPYVTLECFLHDFQPRYNTSDRVIRSTPGITIEPHKFGGVEGVTYLVDLMTSKSRYMEPLIRFYEMNGYRAGHSIRAAPYDFRMGTAEFMSPGGYFSQLKDLIEDTFHRNNATRVHVLGHSLGGPVANLFLSRYVNKQWKDKFIASFISIGGPFGGAPITASLVFTGFNYGIPTLKAEDLLPIIREMGSNAAMFPRIASERPFIFSPVQNYTTRTMGDLFRSVGDERFVSLLERELSVRLDEAPQVPTHCIYGLHYPTPSEFTVKSLRPPVADVTNVDYGDGTVTVDSLRLCDNFANLQREPVNVFAMEKNSSHVEIIMNPDLWAKLMSITAP